MIRFAPAALGGSALLFGLCLASGAQADQMSCADVPTLAKDIPGLVITSSEHMLKGEKAPLDHCVVEGHIDDRTGIDGQHYAISFELRLPDDWNEGYVHQFNGGNDGAVTPATGWLLTSDMSKTALSRGYAVVSSDSGHDGNAQPEAGLAGGNRFGLDPQARIDYGYGAVAKLDPVARQLVTRYYGRDIAHAYGIGGSNGGRHALVEAARMPKAFDGLLVGYPGFNLPKAAIQHAWDVQSEHAVNSDIRKAFSPEDLQLVSKAILKACDGLDGLKDDIVADSDACQSAFDITSLSCDKAGSNACLSDAQITALQRMYAGPTNSKGEALYSNWAWDTGISAGDWRFWKLESPIPPWDHMPLIAIMGAGSLAYLFTTPPTEVGGTPAELEQFLLDFNFDTDAPKIYATNDTFTESAMDYMTPPGVDNPELKAFRDAGGKLIVFQGNSDPVFSVLDTVNWYKKLDTNNGGNAKSFALLYRIPGMTHGPRSIATQDYDFFTPLVNWVEKGVEPGAVVAGTVAGGEARKVLGDITRKLCPYPQVARYKGGDTSSADSFACE